MKKIIFLLSLFVFSVCDLYSSAEVISEDIEQAEKDRELAIGEKIGMVEVGEDGHFLACRFSKALGRYVWYGQDFGSVTFATIKGFSEGKTKVRFDGLEGKYLIVLNRFSYFVGQ